MLDAPSPSRRQRSVVVLVAVVLIGTAMGAWFARKMSHAPISFSSDIQPILNQNCVQCHGGVRQKNGVSFIFREEALGTGKSGRRTIVPGHPDESELIRRVTSSDPDARMPYHSPPLTAQQIALPFSQRKIPMLQMMREEALAAFRSWQEKPNKIPY